MAEIIAIIVAAGSGSRFGSDIPKQFLDLDGEPVCLRAARCFSKEYPEATIVFVLPEDNFDHWHEFMKGHIRDDARAIMTWGGKTRWESVKNGLSAIPSSVSPSATILVHDGARPLVSGKTIRAVAQATINTDGAIPVVPVTDSLRRLEDDGISSVPVDRGNFRAVQTPQGSKLWRLRAAYDLPYEDSYTDDASVLTAAGFANIVLVEGTPENIKITNPLDLKIARCLI